MGERRDWRGGRTVMIVAQRPVESILSGLCPVPSRMLGISNSPITSRTLFTQQQVSQQLRGSRHPPITTLIAHPYRQYQSQITHPNYPHPTARSPLLNKKRKDDDPMIPEQPIPFRPQLDHQSRRGLFVQYIALYDLP